MLPELIDLVMAVVVGAFGGYFMYLGYGTESAGVMVGTLFVAIAATGFIGVILTAPRRR